VAANISRRRETIAIDIMITALIVSSVIVMAIFVALQQRLSL
jgi:hypothetical protein